MSTEFNLSLISTVLCPLLISSQYLCSICWIVLNIDESVDAKSVVLILALALDRTGKGEFVFAVDFRLGIFDGVFSLFDFLVSFGVEVLTLEFTLDTVHDDASMFGVAILLSMFCS